MRRRWIGAALLGLAVLAVLSVGAVLDLRPDASAESDSESVSNAAYKSVQDVTKDTEAGTPRSVTRDSETLPPAALQEVVTTFLSRSLAAQMRLESVDLSDLYVEVNENALLNQASIDWLVQARRLQPQDLTMRAAEYGVTYLECKPLDNGDWYLFLYEDQAVQFTFLEGRTSYSAGIEHNFVLTHTPEGWRVVEHRRIEDGFLLLEELLSAQAYDAHNTLAVSRLLNGLLSELLVDARAQLTDREAQKQAYLADPEAYLHPDLAYAHAYDREAALAYAAAWVDPVELKRNPAWDVFDNLGGNCNNYVSQCLIAGGIPMDTVGTIGLQWKYYSGGIDARQVKQGRSSSWTGVGAFFAYCAHNTGYGLAAWADGNLYAAQPGDVVQLGALGDFRHSVLVSEVVTDAEGNMMDLLLYSNTTDRIDYPMSAYAYTNVRLVQVLGWNG